MTRDKAMVHAQAFALAVLDSIGVQHLPWPDGIALTSPPSPQHVVTALNAMTEALACALAGEPLPAITPLEKKPSKSKSSKSKRKQRREGASNAS